MPFYTDACTPESVKAEILEMYEGDLDTRAGSFFDLIISPIAFEIYKNRMDREAIMGILFPDETSGIYIDMDGERYNITRRPGTYAEATVNFTGAEGTVIPESTAFFTADMHEYRLLEAVTLTDGAGTGILRAVDVGEEYNADAGAISQIYSSIPGLESYTAGEAAGGADAESNLQLLERIDAYRKHPSSSGNRYDYYNWAMSVSGVGDAYVQGLWDGPGTVKVTISGPDGGKAAPETVEAVTAYIEEQRPIGPAVTVESATERKISVAASVNLTEDGELKAVKRAFEESFAAYLSGLGLAGGVVSYNKVAYLLLNIEGVADFVSLTVDGGAAPVPIAASVGVVPGDIEITEAGG